MNNQLTDEQKLLMKWQTERIVTGSHFKETVLEFDGDKAIVKTKFQEIGVMGYGK